MYRVLAATSFIFFSAPATAQQAMPFKLVVAFDRGGVTVVDYPSAARCERARVAIYSDFQERLDRSRANAAPGAIITGSPYHFEAVCVPG